MKKLLNIPKHQKGGTLTPQDLDISKFLKNYPVKYRRTSKGISPEGYAKYMKLMRTATGDDVVEFLLKEGYITFKNQTKKFLNPDGPITNDRTPENLNQFSWWDVVPGVGTYRDLQRSYYNPSTKNISIAALSTAGDILGAGVLFKTLKNAGRLSKVYKTLKASKFKPLDESKTLWQKMIPKYTEPLLSGYRYPGYKLEYKNIPSLDLSQTASWGYGYIPTKTIIESNK